MHELTKLEELEMHLLLEALYNYYGCDFRDYAASTLYRRIWNCVEEEGLVSISGLQERVLRDRSCLQRLLYDISVNVSSMFRDPELFIVFRERVIPFLKTYPFIRIWAAGCSSGEEVYSI